MPKISTSSLFTFVLIVFPGEVGVFGFGADGGQYIAQLVAAVGQLFEVFVQPHGVVARGGELLALQVEELISRYVVGHYIIAGRL